MRNVLANFIIFAIFVNPLHAQMNISGDSLSKSKADSLAKAKKDSLRFENLKASAFYPVIKAGDWSGVLPVKNIDAVPDPGMKYKLLINLTLWDGDSASKRQLSGGLTEICRLINLHVASGIPLKNLDIVVVAHAGALNSFLTDSAYRKKFNLANPNLETIHQLASLKINFFGCGQAEQYLNIEQDELLPELKTAMTAQVMLSYYQMKGYALFLIDNAK